MKDNFMFYFKVGGANSKIELAIYALMFVLLMLKLFGVIDRWLYVPMPLLLYYAFLFVATGIAFIAGFFKPIK